MLEAELEELAFLAPAHRRAELARLGATRMVAKTRIGLDHLFRLGRADPDPVKKARAEVHRLMVMRVERCADKPTAARIAPHLQQADRLGGSLTLIA